MEQRRHQRRAGRARAAALAAAIAALVGAGEAVAGDALVPELGTSENPGAALEQAAEQASQTHQTAGAGAAAVQEGATNVALPSVEASPGAQTVVIQANDANAVSEAANGAETTQVADQGQQGGPAAAPDLPAPADVNETPAQVSQAPADVNPTPVQVSQGAVEGSATTQVAGAQATAVQTQPVNVAVPVVIASPGADTVVIQTNSATAAAQAANTAATTQAAGQSQSGGQPATGEPQGQPPPQIGLPGSGAGGTGIDLVLDSVVQTGSSTYIWIWDWTWNWDWDWDWSTGGIDLPPIPSLPPEPGWTPPGDEANPVRPPEQAKGPRNGLDGGSPSSLVAPTTPAYESLPPAPLTSASRDARRGADASSIFVQSDAEPASGRLFLPPIGRYAAPGGSAGAGIAPLTLVAGALLALALQIFSAAGLLGRRFALTSVGWRRQAYLTPLERPG